MTTRTIQPRDWTAPRGYANGMAAKGTFLAVAGQVGWDAQQHLVDGGFLTQFEQALRNVAAVVEAAGGSASDVVSLTIYVVDCREYTADLAAVGGAYRRVMGRHFPAMALVQVAALLEEGARVEIQGLAVLPEGSP